MQFEAECIERFFQILKFLADVVEVILQNIDIDASGALHISQCPLQLQNALLKVLIIVISLSLIHLSE